MYASVCERQTLDATIQPLWSAARAAREIQGKVNTMINGRRTILEEDCSRARTPTLHKSSSFSFSLLLERSGHDSDTSLVLVQKCSFVRGLLLCFEKEDTDTIYVMNTDFY